jgi:hypothetical protein
MSLTAVIAAEVSLDIGVTTADAGAEPRIVTERGKDSELLLESDLDSERNVRVVVTPQIRYGVEFVMREPGVRIGPFRRHGLHLLRGEGIGAGKAAYTNLYGEWRPKSSGLRAPGWEGLIRTAGQTAPTRIEIVPTPHRSADEESSR